MFSNKAKWIWDGSDRKGYHHYIQARREFSVTTSQLSTSTELLITADAYYQVWVNGKVVGHGPAKSAHGKRSVDTYDLSPFLQVGENTLDITALSVGVGMMTYCCGNAGLIYQINLGKKVIVSDSQTKVRADPTRQKMTSRRWIMPCVEDINAEGMLKRGGWKTAIIIDNTDVELYPRRVALPSREVLIPKRIVDVDAVKLPNFNVSFIIKPYVVNAEDKYSCNVHEINAYIVSEIHSPIKQTLILTPALANVSWSINGKHMIDSNGWSTSAYEGKNTTVQLNKGVNLLVGVCTRTHFEDVTLAGFVNKSITLKNPYGKGMFSFIHMEKDQDIITGQAQLKTDWQSIPGRVKKMNPEHSMLDAASQTLAEGAIPTDRYDSLVQSATLDTLTLPAAKAGNASRTIIDLGVLQNGYLAFDAITPSQTSGGGRLIFSMFEAIKEDPHVVIHWPGINNALTYNTMPGRQSYESFFAYGVRYIAIYHTGNKPVVLKNLRVLTANCNMVAQGSFQTDAPMLNAIYKQGVQSQLSGMDDTFTDCPTFEQVNWNYDNRTTAMATYVTFASDDIIQNSIRLFSEDPGFQGMVRSQYPSEWENFIPLWSFHWIMWVRDYWWQSGNVKFAKDMMPCIKRGLKHALSLRDERGLLSMPGVWHFVDWAQGRDDDHAVNAAEQGGLLGALEAAIELATALGKSQSKQLATWQAEYDALKKAVNKHLWCEKRKAYADALLEDGSHSSVSSMVTNAVLCLHGAANKTRSKMLANRMAQGIDGGLADFGSPLGVFYMTELYDRLGMVKELFKIITVNWGEMVLQGDSCGWEQFQKGQSPDAYWPTRSRCHPCSAVVLKYLARWVLGLEQREAGWKKFSVTPGNTGLNINRVWGSVPTPNGLIRVSWESKSKGKKNIKVISPRACQQV